jgi:hypothetical protein
LDDTDAFLQSLCAGHFLFKFALQELMFLLDNALLDHVLSFAHLRDFPHSILLVNKQMNKVGKPHFWRCFEFAPHDNDPTPSSKISYSIEPFRVEKGHCDKTFVLQNLESLQLVRVMTFLHRPVPGWLEQMLPVIMCNVSEVNMIGEDTFKYLEY